MVDVIFVSQKYISTPKQSIPNVLFVYVLISNFKFNIKISTAIDKIQRGTILLLIKKDLCLVIIFSEFLSQFYKYDIS